MSQELVAALTNASADPAAALERFSAHQAAMDMHQLQQFLGPLPTNGGAMIQPPPAAQAAQPALPMSLPALAGKFSEGLQHGFYAEDMGRLISKIEQSHQPNSGVTTGDMTLELLNVQAKMGIADTLRNIATKLTDGLNTVVVKQG